MNDKQEECGRTNALRQDRCSGRQKTRAAPLPPSNYPAEIKNIFQIDMINWSECRGLVPAGQKGNYHVHLSLSYPPLRVFLFLVFHNLSGSARTEDTVRWPPRRDT